MCMRCIPYRVVDALFALACLTALVLPFLSRQPVVAIAVWVLPVVGWIAYADRLRTSGERRGISLAPLLPTILALQYFADREVPLLGSALVLFGNLAAIAAIVRGNPFPTARVRRLVRSRRR